MNLGRKIKIVSIALMAGSALGLLIHALMDLLLR